jgi:glycosyltransferase involved in cell wall biosynthesis
MKLVVLIPAYNEEDSILQVISDVPKTIAGISETIVLVVDDGSKDKTIALAKQAGAIVVSHPHNKGVGAAFNTGLIKALELGADVLVNIDADGQFAPSDIPLLIAPIIEGKADFVSGDRFTDPNGHQSRPDYMSKLKYWGNKQMSKLVSMLTQKHFADVSCGFRAYSREAMLRLNITQSFTYTQESFIDLANKDVDIQLVPVKVKYFEGRKSRVAGNLFKYIYRTINIISRAYRDYRPLRFFTWLGLAPFLVGSGFGLFALIHYIATGSVTPYKSVAIIGIYLFTMGIVFWIVGLLADMFVRIRQYQEQLLYFEKKRQYTKGGE